MIATPLLAEAISSTHGSERLFFNLDFRIDVRYRAVQAEALVAAVVHAQAADSDLFWPTLFGMFNITVELPNELVVDVILEETRHGVQIVLG